jgi:hypothetical protein
MSYDDDIRTTLGASACLALWVSESLGYRNPLRALSAAAIKLRVTIC